MPIHDQSYRRYRGRRESARSAWTVIAIAGIQTFLKRRMFLGLLLLAWIPFIVRAVQVYLAARFQQITMLAPSTEMFRQFFDVQSLFVFFVTIYVGAGLIANDRRANALQIYLSKPLTRADYIAGKMAILVTFLLLVTWVPGLLLLILQVLFSGSFAFARANLFLVPAITVYSLIEVFLSAFTMLALSSLSNSSRFVAVMYAGAVLFTHALFGAMSALTGSTTLSWMSFWGNLAQLGDLIFRIPLRYKTPIGVTVIAVVAMIAISVSILERRVRGVEVVT